MEKTIKVILGEMKKAVSNQEIVSPTQWLDWALELNSLWGDLRAELTKAEILYIQEMALEMEAGATKAKAEIIVKARKGIDKEMSTYEFYQYMVGRNKIVEEFIKLAKKRATLEQTFN